MKHLILLAIAVLTFVEVSAQQDPQFSQWFNDKQSFNPAAVGIRDGNCLTGFFRNQWSGFDSQPQTVMLNYAGKIDRPGLKGGMGLTFFNDQLGQETNNAFRAMFGYHLNAGDGILSLGLGLGYYGRQLGNQWIAPDELTDPDYSGDNAINDQIQSDGGFDMSFGAYYFKPREYYFGVSLTHLTQSDLEQLNMKLQSHMYIMGGYNFDINSDLVLRTNMLAKTDLNKWAFDVNANVLWNDLIYGGLSFRPGDAIAPMAGLEYCTSNATKTSKSNICYRLGYSYDITTSEIRNFSSGSHEIFLGVCFSYENIPLTNRHANPRFL
jgi:type IX secretion system PorP/SprF family membrane protein